MTAALALGIGIGPLPGCGHATPDADEKPAAAAGQGEPAAAAASGAAGMSGPAPVDRSVVLTPDEFAKSGIVLSAATAAEYRSTTDGFGIVVPGELVAQALTDVNAAAAAARQSHAALERTLRLAGTAGADSATVREAAERQAAADAAALSLAKAKAASTLGPRFPWVAGGAATALRAFASDQVRLVRVSFPLGAFATGDPTDLRLTRLGRPVLQRPWRVAGIWAAPDDSTLPGRSYFAAIEDSDLNEGERLLATAVDSAAANVEKGVVVAASAVVVNGDRYWCYVRRSGGAFARIPVDVGRPVAGGYFVGAGIKPGDPVVTAGAGLLLARGTNAPADTDP